MTGRDWVVPGAQVVLLTRESRSYGPMFTSVKSTTIDRVLKRDVVLANGDRVRTSDLTVPNPHKWDTSTTFLVQADHPDVAMARRGIRRRKAVRRAKDLAERLYEGNSDAPSLEETIEAFEALREFEPEA